MLSHSRTPNETDLSLSLSLSLSFEIVYSFVSFLVVANRRRCEKHFPADPREKSWEIKNNFYDDVFRPFYKTSVSLKIRFLHKKKNKREQKEGGRDEGCDEDDDVRGDEAESDADESADFEDDDDDTDDSKIFFLF